MKGLDMWVGLSLLSLGWSVLWSLFALGSRDRVRS